MTEPNIDWPEALGEHASNPATPRTAGCWVLHAEGKQWRVSPFENRLKAQFVDWLRSNALAEVHRLNMENPNLGESALSKYLADVAAKHYNWDGKNCRGARIDWHGFVYQVFLCLRRCHPDMTEDLAERIVRENVQEATTALAWALGNSEAPAATPNGQPGTKTAPQTLD
jgi:hypothetical protein